MIQRVLAPNPGMMTGTGTNTYLVEDGRGELAVIDPGPDDPAHLQAILDAARPLGRITTILVTHGHSDHLPAALPLAEQTGAPLLGHAQLPGVQRALGEGETAFTSGAVRLVALDTPGHTDDSLCFWDADAHVLFSGDLVAGAGTVVVDEGPGGLARYLGSLGRLRGLGECAIYPGHGPLVGDGQAKVGEYLAHRAEREAQVLAVLRAHGACSVDELVEAIYVEVAPPLKPMAARNVRAQLGKLAGEGRVRQAEDRWSIAGA